MGRAQLCLPGNNQSAPGSPPPGQFCLGWVGSCILDMTALMWGPGPGGGYCEMGAPGKQSMVVKGYASVLEGRESSGRQDAAQAVGGQLLAAEVGAHAPTLGLLCQAGLTSSRGTQAFTSNQSNLSSWYNTWQTCGTEAVPHVGRTGKFQKPCSSARGNLLLERMQKPSTPPFSLAGKVPMWTSSPLGSA